ncbi:Oligopeptide transport system permease protein OppB (TC 3.A.1.5.1) [hydrothermal vent metagenome]|uniref:Oligopeptide transport system permease protein OppB (TC 3.A.1.5.1) n=1 Tax=hydrothermal vent metagenome TaxID=652676 RepID=A0A3B1DH91_9ZZZZ
MIKYILKRFLISIPMLLGIALLTFLLMRATPGNYLDSIRLDPQFSEETIAHYEKLYQFDKPLWQQYIQWVKNLVQGELGYSFHYNVPVTRIIGDRLFNTFILSFASFLLTWSVAIPLGIWAALNRNKWIDRIIQFISYFCLSMPSFFVAMILLYWASQSGLVPLGGMYSPNFEDLSFFGKIGDVLSHLIIPTIALSIGSIAGLQRIMRGNMLEVLGQKYILTARAKGLPENRVVYHHALRNAINPLITLLGYEFSSLLSGAALIEIICSWPGLGSLMLTAVRSKDIYLVMASMLMGGIIFLIGNLLADITLAKADPRIRYE